DHVGLLLARCWALAATGRFTDSHQAALEAAALVPGRPSALNTTVATACASVERFLGRYEHAHARLVRALRLLPEPALVERTELLIELTLNEFYRSRYEAMRDWAAPAVSAAKETGDAALVAAAAVMPAFADAMTGPVESARSRRAQAAAAVALDAGDAAVAAKRALASADAADAAGAPVESALSRALAKHGENDRSVRDLQHAAAALDACGAWRYRQGAERELRKLGHHIHRRTRPGTTDKAGIESLTGRELQVARLVVERKTNPQIAEELFLSQKTVETHLRNIFHKMGVTTRTALARAVEPTSPTPSPRPR